MTQEDETDLQIEIRKLEGKYGRLPFLVRSRRNPSESHAYIASTVDANYKVNGAAMIITLVINALVFFVYSKGWSQLILIILVASGWGFIFAAWSFWWDIRAIRALKKLLKKHNDLN